MTHLAPHETVWYHGTAASDWMARLVQHEEIYNETPLIHVGTQRAAYERLHDQIRFLLGNGSSNMHIYRLRLSASAVIHPQTAFDDGLDTWQTTRDELLDHYRTNVDGVMYQNTCEDRGSYSLLVAYDQIEVVDEVLVDAFEVRSFLGFITEEEMLESMMA